MENAEKKLRPERPTLNRPYQTSPELAELHRLIGQVMTLEKARQSKGLLIDGDLEVPYTDELKAKLKARIDTKISRAASIIQDLQDG